MNQHQHSTEEYITLKDIFLTIGSYFRHVISSTRWLLLGAILGASLWAAKLYITTFFYTESITFMMDNDTGGKAPGVSDLLGNLFSDGKNEAATATLLQLFQTRKVIGETVFDSATIAGRNDLLINHFLDIHTVEDLVDEYKTLGLVYLNERWPKRLLDHTDLRFKKTDHEGLTGIESLMFRLVYNRMSGNSTSGIDPLLSTNLDEESGIMTLTMQSNSEDFTFAFLNTIYHKLSKFYIDKSVEKQQKTYNIIAAKLDSVTTELAIAEYKLADFKDSNRKLTTVKGFLDQSKLQRDVNILSSLYGQAVSQMDATDFALKNKMPIIQVIDFPTRPIVLPRKVYPKEMVKGALVGLIFTAFLLVTAKMFRSIME